ncbi:hypothetical protein HDV00_009726 [Rhizophlyctis rosea]|nr:hypothetical protein HDV00_009726 [Rhizophlyctis rosea]
MPTLKTTYANRYNTTFLDDKQSAGYRSTLIYDFFTHHLSSTFTLIEVTSGAPAKPRHWLRLASTRPELKPLLYTPPTSEKQHDPRKMTNAELGRMLHSLVRPGIAVDDLTLEALLKDVYGWEWREVFGNSLRVLDICKGCEGLFRYDKGAFRLRCLVVLPGEKEKERERERDREREREREREKEKERETQRERDKEREKERNGRAIGGVGKESRSDRDRMGEKEGGMGAQVREKERSTGSTAASSSSSRHVDSNQSNEKLTAPEKEPPPASAKSDSTNKVQSREREKANAKAQPSIEEQPPVARRRSKPTTPPPPTSRRSSVTLKERKLQNLPAPSTTDAAPAAPTIAVGVKERRPSTAEESSGTAVPTSSTTDAAPSAPPIIVEVKERRASTAGESSGKANPTKLPQTKSDLPATKTSSTLTDDELKEEVWKLLEGISDFNNVSGRRIREELERRLGIDLTDRKNLIRKFTEELLVVEDLATEGVTVKERPKNAELRKVEVVEKGRNKERVEERLEKRRGSVGGGGGELRKALSVRGGEKRGSSRDGEELTDEEVKRQITQKIASLFTKTPAKYIELTDLIYLYRQTHNTSLTEDQKLLKNEATHGRPSILNLIRNDLHKTFSVLTFQSDAAHPARYWVRLLDPSTESTTSGTRLPFSELEKRLVGLVGKGTKIDRRTLEKMYECVYGEWRGVDGVMMTGVLNRSEGFEYVAEEKSVKRILVKGLDGEEKKNEGGGSEKGMGEGKEDKGALKAVDVKVKEKGVESRWHQKEKAVVGAATSKQTDFPISTKEKDTPVHPSLPVRPTASAVPSSTATAIPPPDVTTKPKPTDMSPERHSTPPARRETASSSPAYTSQGAPATAFRNFSAATNAREKTATPVPVQKALWPTSQTGTPTASPSRGALTDEKIMAVLRKCFGGYLYFEKEEFERRFEVFAEWKFEMATGSEKHLRKGLEYFFGSSGRRKLRVGFEEFWKAFKGMYRIRPCGRMEELGELFRDVGVRGMDVEDGMVVIRTRDDEDVVMSAAPDVDTRESARATPRASSNMSRSHHEREEDDAAVSEFMRDDRSTSIASTVLESMSVEIPAASSSEMRHTPTPASSNDAMPQTLLLQGLSAGFSGYIYVEIMTFKDRFEQSTSHPFLTDQLESTLTAEKFAKTAFVRWNDDKLAKAWEQWRKTMKGKKTKIATQRANDAKREAVKRLFESKGEIRIHQTQFWDVFKRVFHSPPCAGIYNLESCLKEADAERFRMEDGVVIISPLSGGAGAVPIGDDIIALGGSDVGGSSSAGRRASTMSLESGSSSIGGRRGSIGQGTTTPNPSTDQKIQIQRKRSISHDTIADEAKRKRVVVEELSVLAKASVLASMRGGRLRQSSVSTPVSFKLGTGAGKRKASVFDEEGRDADVGSVTGEDGAGSSGGGPQRSETTHTTADNPSKRAKPTNEEATPANSAATIASLAQPENDDLSYLTSIQWDVFHDFVIPVLETRYQYGGDEVTDWKPFEETYLGMKLMEGLGGGVDAWEGEVGRTQCT